MLDLVACPDPDCGAPASIKGPRTLLESTDGPVEHARLSCLNKHHFFMPTASLTPL